MVLPLMLGRGGERCVQRAWGRVCRLVSCLAEVPWRYSGARDRCGSLAGARGGAGPRPSVWKSSVDRVRVVSVVRCIWPRVSAARRDWKKLKMTIQRYTLKNDVDMGKMKPCSR